MQHSIWEVILGSRVVCREASSNGKEANTRGIREQSAACRGSVPAGPLSEGAYNMPELPHLKGMESEGTYIPTPGHHLVKKALREGAYNSQIRLTCYPSR